MNVDKSVVQPITVKKTQTGIEENFAEHTNCHTNMYVNTVEGKESWVSVIVCMWDQFFH